MLDSTTLFALTSKFLIGTLIFIRILGVMAGAPIFKNDVIIPQVKIFLAIILSISVTSVYWQEQPTIEFHVWFLALIVLKEFLFGLIIGFSINLVFFAARMAGGLIDTDLGFQTAAMFDLSSQNPTLLGEFKEMIALMLFLSIDGHHQIIEAIYISMKAVPLLSFAMTETTEILLVKYATTVLILSIKIASPILVAMFCTNLGLALLARIAPQTNIFILSFQFKISIGLTVLLFSSPLMIYIIKWTLGIVQSQSLQIIMSLNPANVP